MAASRTLAVIGAFLVGCGSTGSPSSTPVAHRETETATAAGGEREKREAQERKDQLAEAHNKLLDEQATALAATCEKPALAAQKRCTPSCYPAEPADARTKKIAGAAEIMHLVCTRSTDPAQGPFMIADEIGGAKLEVRAAHGRTPKANKKGTWQAAVETEVTTTLQPELAHGDVVHVTGAWKSLTHPVSKERLRCVTVSHYTRSLPHALDACGSRGAIACEATNNAAALGLNVVHYRLAEAKRLQAAHDGVGCQRAALEAVAVARGLPRWRQYVKLNTDQWKTSPRYRTRFDGVLDEDALFSIAIDLGTEAEAVSVACGGAENPKTTVTDEQSFHTCGT